jgi:hypothetical protein
MVIAAIPLISTITMETRPKIMNPLSWTAEGIFRVCEIVSIGAGVIAVVALIGQVITGRSVRDAQALQIVKLEGDNIEAQRKLEAERITRLEMEKTLSPRLIERITFHGEDNFEPLKVFAGMNVIFEFLPDAEPRRFADNLAAILKTAGWNLVSGKIRNDILFSATQRGGVFIEVPSYMEPAGVLETRAAKAIVAFLEINNIEAREFPPGLLFPAEPAPPANTLRIIVGLKPDTYFEDKADEELRSRTGVGPEPKWFKKNMEEYKVRRREDAERLLEELLQEQRARKAKQPPK